MIATSYQHLHTNSVNNDENLFVKIVQPRSACRISCAIVCSNDRQIKVPRCNAISTWLFSAASEKRNRLRLKTRLGILKESQHAHAIERVVPGSMCDNGGWQQKFTLVKFSFGTHVIFLLSIG